MVLFVELGSKITSFFGGSEDKKDGKAEVIFMIIKINQVWIN